jgi:hypothetical protein
MSENPYSTPAPITDELQTPRSFLKTGFKIFMGVGIAVLAVALFTPVNRGREAPRRTQCKNNLKQIVLALHNYHDMYESFPPAYTADANGTPLHSWRTLILPGLEQKALYDKIDLSKPWNHPANAEAFKTTPHVFRCPSSDLLPTFTSYLAVAGENSCFHRSSPRSISEITDGTSNTLIVIEVPPKHAVHWMSPQDADEPMILSISNNDELAHTGGVQGALADGSIRFLSATIAPETRRALITRNGNEPLGEF